MEDKQQLINQIRVLFDSPVWEDKVLGARLAFENFDVDEITEQFEKNSGPVRYYSGNYIYTYIRNQNGLLIEFYGERIWTYKDITASVFDQLTGTKIQL